MKHRIGNIALFFGSFNPFHLGHLRLGEYILSNKLFDEVWYDEVWYIVSPCNPLKNQADLIDEKIRLQMLKGAIKHNRHLKASNIEFSMPIPSYTIDTLTLLTHKFPENKFSLLIGSDNALVFDKWKNYKQLTEKFDIVVYPRTGYNFNEVAAIYPQMKLLQSSVYDISSTQIREFIKQKKDITNMVHPFVNQFIIQHNLYQ